MPRKLIIVPGGEICHDFLVPEKGRVTFRLDWEECHGLGPVAEILLETPGRVSRVFQKVPPSCDERSKKNSAEVLSLNEFSGSRSALVFRVPAATVQAGSQRVVFSQLLLEEPKD
ncbi:MAG: hypothetical protein EXQ58_04705 [Acidobacteria bacterium]|nr:hypothetical protein [Acidobacteriota bacterium]